jgi:hypothetical protein
MASNEKTRRAHRVPGCVLELWSASAWMQNVTQVTPTPDYAHSPTVQSPAGAVGRLDARQRKRVGIFAPHRKPAETTVDFWEVTEPSRLENGPALGSRAESPVTPARRTHQGLKPRTRSLSGGI